MPRDRKEPWDAATKAKEAAPRVKRAQSRVAGRIPLRKGCLLDVLLLQLLALQLLCQHGPLQAQDMHGHGGLNKHGGISRTNPMGTCGNRQMLLAGMLRRLQIRLAAVRVAVDDAPLHQQRVEDHPGLLAFQRQSQQQQQPLRRRWAPQAQLRRTCHIAQANLNRRRNLSLKKKEAPRWKRWRWTRNLPVP